MCLINLSELSASFNNNKRNQNFDLQIFDLISGLCEALCDDDEYFSWNARLRTRRLMTIHSPSNDYISFWSFFLSAGIRLLVGASNQFPSATIIPLMTGNYSLSIAYARGHGG